MYSVPPSWTSPRGWAKLSAPRRWTSAPRSSRAAFTFSSSRKIRIDSSSRPQTLTRLTPSTASSFFWTCLSMSVATSWERSFATIANHMIGMSPSSLAQTQMRSTVSGSSARARSIRSRSSAFARSVFASPLYFTRRRTRSLLE